MKSVIYGVFFKREGSEGAANDREFSIKAALIGSKNETFFVKTLASWSY
jgi:hypothetical protein